MITTHVQWKSVVLETIGNNHYLRMNGDTWKLTSEQLTDLLYELEPINNPLTAANFLVDVDKSGYNSLTGDTDKEIFESQFGK